MRRALLALALLLCSAPSWAVSATQYDGIAKTSAGVAINAATCTVYVSSTSATKATIFSDTGGSSQANPFTTASNGTYTIFLVSGRYRIDCSNGTTVFSNFVTMPTQTTGGGPALPVSVPNGGTAASSLTSHGVVIGQGTSAVHVTAAGATGKVLTGNTGADPTWQDASGLSGLGSTDNAIIRADGTGGATAQGSGLTISDTASNLTTLGAAGTDSLVIDFAPGVSTAPRMHRTGTALVIEGNDNGGTYTEVSGGRFTANDASNPSVLFSVNMRQNASLCISDGNDFNACMTAGVGSALSFPSIQISDPGTRPTCDSTTRGIIWRDNGGAGVADTIAVCCKNAADAYVWSTVLGTCV